MKNNKNVMLNLFQHLSSIVNSWGSRTKFGMTTVLAILYLFNTISPVLAVTATPSASDKAQELLDRVATKVAQLAQTFKKGSFGTVSSLSAKSFQIDNQKIQISEVTNFYKYSKGARTSIEFKNITKDTDVTVIGNLDPATNEMMATQVIAKVVRVSATGTVTEIDKKKNIYTLSDGSKAEIDATTAIKKSASSSADLTKAKTTDISTGSNLIVIGYKDTPESPITALKAVIF